MIGSSTLLGRVPRPVALIASVAAMAIVSTCSSAGVNRWELVPLPKEGVEVTRLSTGPTLNLDRVRFYASELGEARFFLALVPNGPGPVRNVLILNHGWADRPEDLLLHLKLEEVYAGLLATQAVSRAIIVLPDIRFPNSFRVNAGKYPFNHSLVLVADEVAGLVSRHYRVEWDRERWSIGGLSFGGNVALDVVRRYPGRFGSAAVVSSFYDEEWAFWPATPPPPGRLDDRGRGKQTVVVPGPAPRLLLACGTEDRFYPTMVKLNTLLGDRGISSTWMSARGGHTWAYWSTMVRPMITFLLGSASGSAATTATVARPSARP